MTTDILNALDSDQVLLYLSQMTSFIEKGDFADWQVFNQAKRAFLDHFKAYQSQDKQKIWKEFTDVADAARAIKKHQEEEGEFAAEMISQALDAHELELQNQPVVSLHHALFDKVTAFRFLKSEIKNLLGSMKFLTTKAFQLQALRQELTKTGMRLSIKGKLFDRLSKLGDQVFPVKKEYNKQLVACFNLGLEAFIKGCQKREDGEEILFEIRVIQSFLKEMTLKKQEYDLIKTSLDPIWKQAVILKDKKQLMFQEAQAQSLEIKKTFEAEFEALKGLVTDGQDQEAIKKYDSLILKIKDRSIQKQDYKMLKNDLELVSKPVFDRLKEQKDLKIELLKKQASEQQEEKDKLFAQLDDTQTSFADKKTVLNQALAYQLNPREEYKFKLAYFVQAALFINEPTQLQQLYVEVKKLQESIRMELATSSFDLGVSMELQECAKECKQILTQLLAKL